jgi:alpha-tubulin suppressor-like RCC1 family protein
MVGWGAGDYGQLGDGTIAGSLTPVDVCDAGPLTMLDAGDSHTCALSAAGGVVCWGSSMYGQLGDPSSGPKLLPVDILR